MAVPDLIVLSVPVFFALLGAEALVSWRKKLGLYRFADTLSNLSCGTIQQITSLLLKAVIFGTYEWVFRNASLPALFGTPALPGTPLGWVAAFVIVDFAYYWFHRLSHEVAFLWAAHAVHHQSEEYNLSVALRQSSLQELFNFAFFLPLAFLGFPTVMVITVFAVNLIYQFWIHTRLIGKLGPLEWVLNTPSHHRVHHGRNPIYLDRNHAGTFIVWDRLFGTFQEELDEPVYGVVTPLRSFDPIEANVRNWKELLRLRKGIRVFLGPPGQGEPAPEVDARTAVKFDVPIDSRKKIGSMAAFALLMAGSLALLHRQEALVAASAVLLLGFSRLGAWLSVPSRGRRSRGKSS